MAWPLQVNGSRSPDQRGNVIKDGQLMAHTTGGDSGKEERAAIVVKVQMSQ